MDVSNLSPDHIFLHRSGSDNKPVISRFNASTLKFPFDTKVAYNIPYNKRGSGNDHSETIGCVFDNNKLDNIRMVYITFKMPYVAVNPQWADRMQIRWTDKVVHHIVGSTLLKVMMNKNGSSKNMGTFFTDPVWSDIYLTYSVKDKGTYNLEIGQIDELMEWSTELPEVEVHYKVPWVWTQHLSQSFPIHNNVGTIMLESSYTLAVFDQVAKFLRVRVRTEEVQDNHIEDRWVYITPVDSITKYLPKVDARNLRNNVTNQRLTPSHHPEYVDGSGTDDSDGRTTHEFEPSDTRSILDSNIQNGSLNVSDTASVVSNTGRLDQHRRKLKSGIYARIRNGRVRSYKYSDRAVNLLTFEKKNNPPKIYVSGTKQDPAFLATHISEIPICKYFTYDTVLLVREDVLAGSKKTFKLSGPDLHHAIYIFAKNKKACSFNSLSNYTTNAINPSIGINPIKWIVIKVGDMTVFDGDTSMLKIITKESFPNYVEEIGHNAYSFSFNPFSPYNDTAYRCGRYADVDKSRGNTSVTVELTLERLNDDELDTDFLVHIYSTVKRQVVHDRSVNEVMILKGNFSK